MGVYLFVWGNMIKFAWNDKLLMNDYWKFHSLLFITKVDKGGCILILDVAEVNKIMEETLNDEEKFEKMQKDPRPEITFNFFLPYI